MTSKEIRRLESRLDYLQRALELEIPIKGKDQNETLLERHKEIRQIKALLNETK